MTENKRFRYYEHKGADYILDNPNTELDFIEMLGDCLEAEEIVDRLNEQDKEIQKLKQKVNGLKSELTIWKEDANEHIQETNKLFEENKQLKKELFESEKDYIIETYSDNPTRRDEKIQGLKEEFKQR